jgi:hypothetical protein
MGTLLVAAVVLGLPAQDKPLGEISKEQFLQEIRALGYVVLEEGKESPLIVEGSTRAHIGIGFGRSGRDGPRFVNNANGRLEFDLPRSLPKKALQDWRKAQGLSERVSTGSFLGGRLFVDGQVMRRETTRSELKRNIRELFESCSKVAKLAASRGGRASPTVHQLGTCLYEPGFKLDWIEREDMDYMREKLKWEHTSAMVIRGWVTGGVVLGVPIVFTGFQQSPWIALTFMPQKPDLEKLKRLLQNSTKIDWADYHEITEKAVYIQKRLNFPEGVTVRELENHILDFARKIKALDLI